MNKERSPEVYINDERCRNSYSCIRVCPVKAIEVRSDREHPFINPARCIGCGLCYISCTPGAVSFRDSIDDVKRLLDSDIKCAALIAPSISSEFEDITDYRKFVGMIRELGFDYVYEDSFGVDLVAHQYAELFSQSRGKYHITANCPAIVKMIEKHYPSLVPNLAPIISPMVATARVVRQIHNNNIATVFIGPCIDAKDEALLYDDGETVNSVLTFIELREMFNRAGIQERKVQMSEFDPPFGNWGALYPLPAGILKAAGIRRDIATSQIITASGKEDVVKALNDFDKHIDTIKHHFNLFFCNGCMMGPGMVSHKNYYKMRALVRNYALKRVSTLDKKRWEQDIEKWSSIDFSRQFTPDDQNIPDPPEEAVREVLKIIDKEDNNEEVNCGVCGYLSCRDFAVTVAKGLAVPEMCQTFNIRNKQQYIETLRHTNKKLAETKKALKESEELALKEKELAQNASEMMNSMLEKLPSGVIIADNNLKVVHSNNSFIDIIGEEARAVAEVIPGLAGADLKTLLPYPAYNMFSYVIKENEAVINRDITFEDKMLNISVFPIRQNKIAGAVIRDLFSPEVQGEEIINRIGEAIEKNLEMVQQIGFLLGEGASETERMLNSIIDSYSGAKDSKKKRKEEDGDDR